MMNLIISWEGFRRSKTAQHSNSWCRSFKNVCSISRARAVDGKMGSWSESRRGWWKISRNGEIK